MGNASTETSAESSQEYVVAEEASARTTQAVTIASVLVDTEWTSEETSALISMNAVVAEAPDLAAETARTCQDLSGATAGKVSLLPCLAEDVPMLMSAQVDVDEEVLVDQTNNVRTALEASSVVAAVDSVWSHKEAAAVM